MYVIDNHLIPLNNFLTFSLIDRIPNFDASFQITVGTLSCYAGCNTTVTCVVKRLSGGRTKALFEVRQI